MYSVVRVAVAVGALGALGCAATRSETTPVATGGPPPGPISVSNAEPGTIPSGQLMDVRLESTLSSDIATVEQQFDTTTLVDLVQGGRTLVPAGSQVRGVVSAVDRAGRIDRSGSLTLAFTSLRVEGHEMPIRAMATQIFESGGLRDEAGRAGVGAGVGGIIGGVLGGLRGAMLGAVIGGGGVIAATEGMDVQLPAGTVIRIRLEAPVDVR